MTAYIILYVFCAYVSYLGFKYKHIFSDGYRYKGIRDKDWLFILIPIVNYFTVAWVIMLVIFGTAGRIDDFMRK